MFRSPIPSRSTKKRQIIFWASDASDKPGAASDGASAASDDASDGASGDASDDARTRLEREQERERGKERERGEARVSSYYLKLRSIG